MELSARGFRAASEAAKADLARACARLFYDRPLSEFNDESLQDRETQWSKLLSRWVTVDDDHLTDKDLAYMPHRFQGRMDFHRLVEAFGFGPDLFSPEKGRLLHALFSKEERSLIYATFLYTILHPYEELPHYIRSLPIPSTRAKYVSLFKIPSAEE